MFSYEKCNCQYCGPIVSKNYMSRRIKKSNGLSYSFRSLRRFK